MIRITVHSATHVTVTRSPGLAARWLLGREETVRHATHLLIGFGRDDRSPHYEWIYDDDNREVEEDVAAGIERALVEISLGNYKIDDHWDGEAG